MAMAATRAKGQAYLRARIVLVLWLFVFEIVLMLSRVFSSVDYDC